MSAMANPYWEGVQLAAQLRAAADQHQALQEQMRQRQADLDLRQQAQQWQHQQQGFQDLAGALQNGWQPASSGNVAQPGDQVAPGIIGVTPSMQDTRRQITPPGQSQAFYVPTVQETAQREGDAKVSLQKRLNEANDMPMPPAMQLASGMPEGSMMPRQSYDTMLGRMFAAQEAASSRKTAAPRNAAPHFVADNNGNVTALTYNPDAAEGQRVKVEGKFAGIGSAKKAKGGPKPATAAEIRSVSDARATELEKAEEAFAKSKVAGMVDPAAVAELNRAKQAAQDKYEQDLALYGIETPHIQFKPVQAESSQQSAVSNQPAQKPAAQQKPAQQAPKKASLSQVRAYAAKKGINEAQALREFKDYGYAVGQ